MIDFLLSIMLLLMLLWSADALSVAWYVGLESFMAPRWVRLPGGMVYWFLVKGHKP